MKKFLVASFCFISFNLLAQTTIPKSIEILGDQRIEEYTALVNTLTEIQQDAEKNKPQFSNPTEYINYVNEKWYGNYEFDFSGLGTFYDNYQNSPDYLNSIIQQSEISDNLKNWIKDLNEKMETVNSEEALEYIILEFATQVTTLELSSHDRMIGESFVLIVNGTYKVAGDAYERNNNLQRGGFWGGFWSVVKCGLGTAGSAGIGALTGAAVGTVTLPIVGTVSGTVVGLYSGTAVGVATFCM